MAALSSPANSPPTWQPQFTHKPASNPSTQQVMPIMPSRILSFRRSHLPSPRDHKLQTDHLENFADIDTGDQRRHAAAMDLFHFASRDKRQGTSGHSTPKAKGSPKVAPTKAAKLEIEMESPPCVFYGGSNSSGALFSGQLKIIVTDPEVRLTSINMECKANTVTKKPVHKDCPDCINRVSSLKSWNFITEPTTYSRGTHHLPFSYLLPGHLPATTHSSLANIDYALEAKAVTTLADTIALHYPLRVQRALQPSPDKQSVRVFPPTNLTVNVIHTPIIHPIGSFLVQFRMNGVVNKERDAQTRWRIRKLDWRIDEHTRNISPACPKHAHKVGGEGKGQQHEDIRMIGSDAIKKGWKTDFDMEGGGQIEMEFPAQIRPGCNPVCDVDSPTGLMTTHSLIIEIIVAEEHAKNTSIRHAVPTGAARVLRTQFKVMLTERGGLGVSWDEEIPPMYEDVPVSPPGYGTTVTDYFGEDLPVPPEEDLEHMGIRD
ncbi:MAG: hypothetical protein LQ344_003446 [Seirophora lacunosa]|nr:MAG: hypothetical protein LQ344_003446 [Seirophora lacunosa]